MTVPEFTYTAQVYAGDEAFAAPLPKANLSEPDSDDERETLTAPV